MGTMSDEASLTFVAIQVHIQYMKKTYTQRRKNIMPGIYCWETLNSPEVTGGVGGRVIGTMGNNLKNKQNSNKDKYEQSRHNFFPSAKSH